MEKYLKEVSGLIIIVQMKQCFINAILHIV